jgi:cyclopropane-fatty-acyl-phospholipid synthase
VQAGVRFTGITNSEVSQLYLRSKLANFGDRFDILLIDFYEFEPKKPFDSIVIMGVIEHLPHYERVLKKFYRLLKPGGRMFLDGSAAKKKYELSTFMVRHIYPGNHSFLVLDDLLNKLAKTELELMEVQNDRWSYYLTFKQWALNLEANKDYVQRAFGETSSTGSSVSICGGRLTSSSHATSIATASSSTSPKTGPSNVANWAPKVLPTASPVAI